MLAYNNSIGTLKDIRFSRVANWQQKLRGNLNIVTIALDRLPKQQSQKILCFYGNNTRKMQIARVSSVENKYWERTVFPGERFFFEATPEAKLEIDQPQENGKIKSESFLCEGFKVNVDVDE